MIRTIADIFGIIGMGYFLKAEIHQFIKIRRTGKITGISATTYRSKIIACLASLVCLGLSGLFLSFIVLIAEVVVVIPMYLKLRRGKK